MLLNHVFVCFNKCFVTCLDCTQSLVVEGGGHGVAPFYEWAFVKWGGYSREHNHINIHNTRRSLGHKILGKMMHTVGRSFTN